MKRKADNSIQLDEMLKITQNPDKKPNRSQYFKKDGYFEEDKADVGTKNNVAMVRFGYHLIQYFTLILFDRLKNWQQERLLSMLK